LEDRPKRIKGQLFPFDDVDIDALLSELATGSDPFVIRYQVSSIGYICIPKFLAHQRPHGKEPASIIPAPESSKTGAKKQSRGKVSASTTKSASSPTLTLEPYMGNGEPLMGNGEPVDAPDSDTLPQPDSPEALVLAWNTLTVAPFPRVKELTDQRRVKAKARLRERPMAVWRDVIKRIAQSGFCRGEGRDGWVADFDFLLKPETAAKALEGKYDNRSRSAPIDVDPNAAAWDRVNTKLGLVVNS
jgi:hypothetical protein